MTRKEHEALDADHPEWVELSYDQIRERYWMYDLTIVRLARADAHFRIAMQPFERLFLWIARLFERWNR